MHHQLLGCSSTISEPIHALPIVLLCNLSAPLSSCPLVHHLAILFQSGVAEGVLWATCWDFALEGGSC